MLRRVMGFGSTHAFGAMTVSARFAASDVSAELATELKQLITKDRVVVFLTGTPVEPRCGFTMRMVNMLEQFQVKYSFVNILESDAICEGLKRYSDWPTYPQLYVDGELIGGYDVTKQMALDGSLTKLLKEKKLFKQ